MIMSILNEIYKKAQNASSPEAAVIFDLDDTIFDSRYRKLKIINDFADALSQPEDAERRNFLKKITLNDLGFNIRESLINKGMDDEPLLNDVVQFWHKEYFTNESCLHDQQVPGALEYVNAIHSCGVFVVYLTGRDVPGMLEGTKTKLPSAGFPFDDRTLLICKPDSNTKDRDFKESALQDLEQRYNVLAAFDNEPENVNVKMKILKNAEVVWLNTRYSNRLERPDECVNEIEDFSSFSFSG